MVSGDYTIGRMARVRRMTSRLTGGRGENQFLVMHRKPSRRMLSVIVGGAVSSVFIGAAWAQDLPNRSITVLNYSASGGAAETMIRNIGNDAGKLLGRTVVVESKPGGGGSVAYNALVRGERDGSLIGYLNAAPLIIRPLAGGLPVPVPGKDYTPVGFIFEAKQVLVANPSVPFRDVKGLIAYAKANPGKLNYGSIGVGSVSHLSMSLFMVMTNTEMTHIPYKGSAEAIPQVVANQIQVMTVPAEAKRFVDRGQLVALASAAPERMAQFPDTPTIADTVPGYGITAWYGLIGAPGIPAPVVTRLNEAFNAAMRGDNEVVKKISTAAGLDLIVGKSAEDFRKRIVADTLALEPVVKKAGIKLDE